VLQKNATFSFLQEVCHQSPVRHYSQISMQSIIIILIMGNILQPAGVPLKDLGREGDSNLGPTDRLETEIHERHTCASQESGTNQIN
jgi:hypothetical protein